MCGLTIVVASSRFAINAKRNECPKAEENVEKILDFRSYHVGFVRINNGNIVCVVQKKKEEKRIWSFSSTRLLFMVRLVGLPSGRRNITVRRMCFDKCFLEERVG